MKIIYKKSNFQRLDRVVVMLYNQPTEINEPYRVEEELRKMNSSKYSSTNDTPMMAEPYVSSVGYLGEKDGGSLILEGTFGFAPGTPEVENIFVDLSDQRDQYQYLQL